METETACGMRNHDATSDHYLNFSCISIYLLNQLKIERGERNIHISYIFKHIAQY